MSDTLMLRKDSANYVVSKTPDVCLTPIGSSKVPVPYLSTGFFGNSVRTAKTVRVNGKEAFTTHSRIKSTVGTNPGVDKGVSDSGHLGPAKIPVGSKSTSVESHQSTRIDHSTDLNMSKM